MGIWAAPDAGADSAIAHRLTIGSRVSEAARALLVWINQCRVEPPSKVRVIRTARAAPARVPRQRGDHNVTVREVPLQLPLVVLDRHMAVLEDRWGADSVDGLVVVRDEASLASLAACHDLVWSVSALETQVPAAALPAYLERILGELAGGSTDKQAARNLHVSHRTVSRHVAELLDRLGTHSRMQAGVVAARSGLV